MTKNLLLQLAAALLLARQVTSECLSDPEINAIFAEAAGGPIPTEGSCCMLDVCGIPCPEPVPEPGKGYGIAVTISIIISFVIGVATYFIVHGQAVNFFVAGRSLPLWIVAMTLGAQSVDSNALLGNADLSYKYQFWDGAVIPIGLGISLLLNGIFLAHHVNEDYVFTLPDILAKRYGKIVECLASVACIISFIMLLSGNLVGMGVITSYVWGVSETAGIWIAGGIVWAYTVSGGLFSVAYTDVVQGAMGWSGCLIMALWFIANTDPAAPVPSIGFPGYIYPDAAGEGGVCDMYSGVNCTYNEGACCYNEALWCPSQDNCTTDNGAYPIGDERIYHGQMASPDVLTPFPNAIFWNWATIFILGFGNLGALDFQARCMASKTARTARLGCIIGGCFTFLIGIPFAYMGSISRVYYGPDSIHAVFEADSCATILGLPTCGAWVPDSQAFIKLLTHQAPPVLGAWCVIGIVAASMSTADGAILAMGTVFSHNLLRQFDVWYPDLITPENLLRMTRLSTVPFTLAAAFIGSFYRSSHSAGATGYLLIIAFDIVLATVVPILFAAFYDPKPSPCAALCALLTGAITRVVLEFALPKDGFLILPFPGDEFLNYGVAPSAGLPTFVDAPPEEVWDPAVEACEQVRFDDFTGVDSLAAFVGAILMYIGVAFLERKIGRELFTIPGMQGYRKDTDDQAQEEYGVDKAVAMEQTGDFSSTVEFSSKRFAGEKDTSSDEAGVEEPKADDSSVEA